MFISLAVEMKRERERNSFFIGLGLPRSLSTRIYIWRYLMAGLEWKILFRPRAARGLLQARTAPASRSRPTSDGVTMSARKIMHACHHHQENQEGAGGRQAGLSPYIPNAARTLSRESGGDRGPFSDSEALQTSYSFWIALFASVEAGGICYNLTRAVSD